MGFGINVEYDTKVTEYEARSGVSGTEDLDP